VAECGLPNTGATTSPLPTGERAERLESASELGARGEGSPHAATTALDATALQKLLAWLSPAFPVGAYTYSHGLEWAIEDGTVKNAATLQAWLTAILHHGAGRTDAIIFRHAYAANDEALRDIAALASAFQPSKERHLESVAQGRAFLAAVATAWPNPRLAAAIAALGNDPVPYPVAVAAACAAHDIPLGPALNAALTAFVANVISAGVRAIPIGQSDGQRLIAALGPVVAKIADETAGATLDDLGGIALRADIASMKHETQYTRLFRS
jgi:urease accessory protein